MSNIGQVLATNRPLPVPPRAEVNPAPQQKGVDGPQNYEQIAELNAEIQRCVQPLPSSGKADGVDPSPPAGQDAGGDNVQAPPPGTQSKAEGSGSAMSDAHAAALKALQGKNAYQLMQMVNNGTISDDIISNPEAMRMMLDRVQEFSRMIQLMTNMMQVEHETLTAIIRNIKA